MADMHPAIASFFDQLTVQMQEFLAGVQPDGTTISWTAASPEPRADLIWWSCGISVDPAASVFAGAPEETWNALARAYDAASQEPFENDFAGMVRSIQQTAQARFGAEVQCQAAGPGDAPADRSTSADLEISFRDGALTVTLVLTPELVVALGGQSDSTEIAAIEEPVFRAGDGTNPVDRLLHIEVPVSVSLGRTEMRMKDLLALSNGSIVELEQELGDRVEVRVNNCVIARGEMVAVDGNYGVRILEMVSSQFAGPGSSPNPGSPNNVPQRRGA